MGKTVETPDGKMHEILDDEGILDLIREYAGVDAADYVEGRMEEIKEELLEAEETIEDLEDNNSSEDSEEEDTIEEISSYLGDIAGSKALIEMELEDIENSINELEKMLETIQKRKA